MSIRDHLFHYWPHYSFGTILFWLSGVAEKCWDKTEWIRGVMGWAKPKRKKRRVRR